MTQVAAPQAQAPQAQTGSFMDMFNPGQPQPQLPNPAAQPAAASAAPASTQPAGAAQVSPLDIYAKVFTVDDKAAPNPQEALDSPLFNMDSKAFETAVQGMSFAPQVDAAIMQRIQSGDPAALQQLLNQATQNAFTQAVAFSQRLVEKGVGTFNTRLQGTLPDKFRSLATQSELTNTAPNVAQHAAVKPMLDALQQNFIRANPQSTPKQIAEAMQGFLVTLGQQIAPPAAVPLDPRDGSPLGGSPQEVDWAQLFKS